MTTSPTPYKINLSDDFLEFTKRKLENARFPDELENVAWQGLKIEIGYYNH